MDGLNKMADFISDEDMAKIESQEAPKGFITDDEMSAMEGSKSVEMPKPAYSELESGLLGAAQYGVANFADEIEGGVGALYGKLSGDDRAMREMYEEQRDLARQRYKEAEAANPKAYMTGALGGGLATTLLPIGALAGAGLKGAAAVGAGMGALSGIGASEEEDLTGIAKDAAISGGIGAGAGLAGQAIAKSIPALQRGLGGTADTLRSGAKKLAIKATGATGKEAEKFADDAGAQLLDRKFIRAFDSPEDIAARLEAEIGKSNIGIDESLKALDAKGVTADVGNIILQLEQKIAGLRKDPSQSGLVKKLSSVVDDIKGTQELAVPLSQAEVTKRGFNKSAKNWMDPEAGQAGKAAYRGYRDEVERAATKADPELAKQFIDSKKTHGLLAPIEAAAQRRASQLNQSPFGQFGDSVGGAAGLLSGGGPVGAVVGAVGRRLAAPRLASTAAVGADKLSQIVRMAPQSLGKWAPALQQAAQRGGQSLAVANFVLQQNDPEYRQHLNWLSQDDENSDEDTGQVDTE